MNRFFTLIATILMGILSVSAQENEVTNIADFLALGDGATGRLTLTDAQVNYVSDDNTLVAIQDATAGIVVVSEGWEVKQGDRLNGTMAGTMADGMNGYPELKATDLEAVTAKAGELEIKEIGIGEVADNLMRLVTVKDAYYSTEAINIMDFFHYPGIEKDEEQLMVFDAFNTGLLDEWDEEIDGLDIVGLPIAPESFQAFGIDYALAPVKVEQPEEPAVPEVATIADFMALGDGATGILTLTDAQVNYVSDDNTLVAIQDATAGIVVVSEGWEVKQGDRLNGTIAGTMADGINGYPELKATDLEGITAEAGELEIKEIGIGEVADNLMRLVTVKDTYYSTEAINIMDFFYYPGIEKDDEQLMVFDAFNTGLLDEWDEEIDGFDIVGLPIAPASFKDFGLEYALAPVKVEQPEEPTVPEVATIAEFLALEDGTLAVLNLTDAQVNYVYDDEGFMAIQDATAGISLTNSGIEAAEGQLLNGTVTGVRSDNMLGYPELLVEDDTQVNVTDGTLEAKEISPADAKDNIMRLVTIVDGYYGEELYDIMGMLYYPAIEKDDVQLLLFDVFGTDILGDLDAEVDGLTIQGLPMMSESLAPFGVDVVLMPTKVVTDEPSSGIGTAVASGNSSAVYHLNGVRVEKLQKGLYIVRGKKVAVK